MEDSKIEEKLMQMDERLNRHSRRLQTLETKIIEDEGNFDDLKQEVESMSKKFSVYQNEINNSIKSLKKWLIVIGAVASVAFVFFAIKNEQAASAIISVGATITKFVAM